MSAFEGWAIVELMGHRRRAGRVSEVEMCGAKLLRIDTPTDGEEVTEFYGGNAIFSVRPTTEEVARDCARDIGDPRPVSPLAYRPAAQPSLTYDDVDEDAYDGALSDDFDDERPF